MSITEINTKSLNQLDLNLLLVFDAVYKERHVTQAGRHLSLSQSAVSNALGRLRELLDDPLFVRKGGQMMPTPRALELVGPIQHALRLLEEALLMPASFDPRESERLFRVAMHEHVASSLMPKLAGYLTAHALKVSVLMVPESKEMKDALDAHQVDCVMGPYLLDGARFHRKMLWEEDFVCVVRQGHPQVMKETLSLEEYASLDHILIGPHGESRGHVDRHLEEVGLSRRVAMVVNHHALAPRVVAQSDMVLTMARRLSKHYSSLHALKMFEPPIKLAPVPFFMTWHASLHEHPAHEWFRALVLELSDGV